MTTTFTVKQVPDDVADGLRRRAAGNRRSLQRELLLIIERAAAEPDETQVAAEPPSAYAVHKIVMKRGKPTSKAVTGKTVSGKLTLEQLWQRARALGASMPGESAAIIRRDRDARHRR
ncbi:MAG: hypothetical protein ABI316_08175 [Casimicrobiaceae bacterium]